MEIVPTPPQGQPPVTTPAPAPTPAVAPVGPATIAYEDFTKIELRIATVLECKVHPNADKLLVVQIDLGSEKRQVCAGIRQHYAPEQLVGKQVVVVANLAARTIRGQISQGMILATTDAAGGKVVVLGPIDAVAPGSAIK